MSTTSQSPKAVAAAALFVGREALPEFASRFSRRDFTLPQLFACLVLKEFFGKSYRKTEAFLADWPTLREAIGLGKTPDHTTLQRAARALLKSPSAGRLLEATLKAGREAGLLRRPVELAAIDGTGFESRHVSHYYVRRRNKGGELWQDTTYRRYPKAGIVCDTASHLILSVVPGRGPGPDVLHYDDALYRAWGRTGLKAVVADAGYDAESSHEIARGDMGVESIIPPRIGRPTNKPPSGRWRRLMSEQFDRGRYGQRWQIEAVNSMVKRNQGSALCGRGYWSQYREMHLKCITHNVLILWP